jgi:hypothetical protein
MIGAFGLATAAAGHRRLITPANPLSYGNLSVTGTPPVSNAPLARKLALIGDSRMASISGGTVAQEIATACGEYAWCNGTTFNYAVGGTTIYNARVTQVPLALADNCGVFVILTGTNGARKAGEGDGVDSLANRQTETLGLLAALDQPGATIFLCNEIPGLADGGTGTGSDATKLAHHNWIKALTTGSAGLTNAQLVIVNTWDAVSDGTESTSTNLAAAWRNDGLHPAYRGQEREAKAVWSAMKAHFSGPGLVFGGPSQRLLDGATTASVARGTVPGGWSDATAADGMTYATSGIGAGTVLTVSNAVNATSKTMALRKTPAAITDGILMIEYDLDVSTGPANDGFRNWSPKITPRNFYYGAGSPSAAVNFWLAVNGAKAQDYEMGGRRRMAVHLGQSDTAPRIDIAFQLQAGQVLRLHAVDIYER